MSTNQEDNADYFATLDSNRVQEQMLNTALDKAVSTSGNGINNSNSNNSLLPGWSQNHPFLQTFENELHRVTRFVNIQQEALELSAKAIFLQADNLANTEIHSSVQESYATLHELKQSTRKIVDECIALQEFFASNRNILLANASMADEKLREDVNYSSVVYEILPKTHLNSSLVCVVSDIYNALRQAEEKIINQNNAGGDSLWEAPSSFKRSTTKYWVKDENLTKLMMICAMEAPLLVYGKKGPLTSTKKNDMNVSEGDKLWDSLATRITSIYFDSDNMSLYKERLKRAEGAQLLRARWYGTTMPTEDKIIFLELKTHHEKWVAQKSVKERASVQEKDMIHFLSPVRWQKEDAEQMIIRAKPKLKDDVEELAKQTALLLRMHNLVVKHKLSACVRSVYDRAAFQSSKSNDLRLTLDRNVTLVNERVQRSNDGGQWCLTDSEAQTARASVVPFNVFEVKLASDGPMPTGLAQAEKDSTIVLATKFSKFLTGAAAFNTVPTLPYWAAHPAFYSFFELDRRAGQNPALVSNNTNQGDYTIMGLSNEIVSGIHKIPTGIAIAPKNPARIEPKTYFANERTFVQWISASILLLSVSSFMLEAGSAGDYKTTAAVISLSAFGLVIYSTVLYFQRLNLLKDRQPYGYFNKVNPIFLATVVGMAIFLVWADSIKGKDFLDIFSFSARGESNRRFLRTRLSRESLHADYKKCPQKIIGTKLLIKENLSSLVVDFKRHSFLMTSDEYVYSQPMHDDGSVSLKADTLIKISQSHLQGLAIVGDQLFTVSDGPERTELIEMAWWGTHAKNEKLRVVGRWTLEDNISHIDGFSFVPSTNNSTSMGSFYIYTNSSLRAYSVPARNENDGPNQPADHPMRLKSLNMKVLTQGMTVGDKGSNDHLSTMTTFEGITYILRSEKNVLEAWNLTDGTLLPKMELPATTDDGNIITKWTGFAFERTTMTSTETANIHRGGGGDVLVGKFSSDALFLHLMTDKATFGSQIWSLPILDTPSGFVSIPGCHYFATTNT